MWGQDCFALIDADGSGAIDVSELWQAFRLLNLRVSKAQACPRGTWGKPCSGSNLCCCLFPGHVDPFSSAHSCALCGGLCLLNGRLRSPCR